MAIVIARAHAEMAAWIASDATFPSSSVRSLERVSESMASVKNKMSSGVKAFPRLA